MCSHRFLIQYTLIIRKNARIFQLFRLISKIIIEKYSKSNYGGRIRILFLLLDSNLNSSWKSDPDPVSPLESNLNLSWKSDPDQLSISTRIYNSAESTTNSEIRKQFEISAQKYLETCWFEMRKIVFFFLSFF